MAGQAIRTHIVVPRDLVEEIDRLAGRRRRSEFITEALRERVFRVRQERAFRESAGILKDYDFPDWETPEKTSAWVRRQRAMDDEHTRRKLRGTPDA